MARNAISNTKRIEDLEGRVSRIARSVQALQHMHDAPVHPDHDETYGDNWRGHQDRELRALQRVNEEQASRIQAYLIELSHERAEVHRAFAERDQMAGDVERIATQRDALSRANGELLTELTELRAALDAIADDRAAPVPPGPREETLLDGSTRIVYELPGAPVVGRRLVGAELPDGESTVWVRLPNGLFAPEDDPDNTGAWTEWHDLLAEYNRLALLPLTADELRDEELYGPVGARWGDPSKPCPFVQEMTEDPARAWGVWGPCALRLGHTGPHRDGEGREMPGNSPAGGAGTGYKMVGESVDIPMPDGSTVPGIIPTDRCTCGNPAEHQPGCPRYTRTAGGN